MKFLTYAKKKKSSMPKYAISTILRPKILSILEWSIVQVNIRKNEMGKFPTDTVKKTSYVC